MNKTALLFVYTVCTKGQYYASTKSHNDKANQPSLFIGSTLSEG